MELEQTLRTAFVLHEPRADFEDVVMARLTAGAWRVSQSMVRRRRLLLISSLLAVSAAAAMLVVQYSGSSSVPAMPAAHQFEAITASIPAVVEASTPAQQTSALPSPGAPLPLTPQTPELSQACEVAAAEPPVPIAFTVLLAPLQSGPDDPALLADAQDYYDGIVRQLRSVPGLGLQTSATQIMDGKQADYRITATMLAAEAGPEPGKSTRPRMKLQLETWNGTAYETKYGIASRIPGADEATNCPLQVRNCAANLSGASVALTLQYNWLPRLTTAAQAACSRERSEFARRQIAEQRRVDPSIDIAALRNLIQNLATIPSPTTRANLARRRQDMTRPEMREPLLAALRESTDDASRREIVTLLAVKFADDASVQQALGAVAASSPDTLTRHVAQRVLTGEDPWRDFVIHRLRDTSLPPAQRLEPLFWIADTMPVNQQKLDAEVAHLLTALKQGDAIRTLAEFLAGTQMNPRDTTQSLLIQQGQRTMRQITSVDHPAVPELLIAYFDTAPNYLTVAALAARRDQPTIMRKLESIAAGHPDPQVQRMAARYLNEPLNPPQPAPLGN